MTTNLIDLTARSRARGIVRTAFGRPVESRSRPARRHTHMPTAGMRFERIDLFEVERRSMFECGCLERR